MPDVFVSYARDDRARVEQIAHALEARGFDVWWDPELLAGESYAQKIATALQTAKAVVVVWSKTSAARPWVLDEASVGLNRGVLIPVIIDGVEPPLGFRQLQAEDLSAFPGRGDANFERLVLALQRLRSGGAEAVAPLTPKPAVKPKGAKGANRTVMIGGAVVLAVLGLAALSQVFAPGPGAGPANPDPGEVQAVYGAAERYGLTPQEEAVTPADKLVRMVMSRTTIESVRAGADAGDPLGQALMCLAYDHGVGVSPDALAARGWCERASDNGSPLGQYMMAWAYKAGNYGVPIDPVQAMQLMQAAAEGGDARAQGFLGSAYLMGTDGFVADDAAAVQYLRRAAEVGHMDSQYNLAWIYENGRGVPQDYATAMVWYRKLAAEGSAVGERAVGWMTYNGWGVAADKVAASEHYRRASDLGDWQGSYYLALMHESGEVVAQDGEEAKRLMRLAETQVCPARFNNPNGCGIVMGELKRMGLVE